MHVFRSHSLQDLVGFTLGHGQNNLHRLVRELKNMRRVMSAGVANTFRCADDRRPSDTALANLLQNPFTKRQLIAVHTDLRITSHVLTERHPYRLSCIPLSRQMTTYRPHGADEKSHLA